MHQWAIQANIYTKHSGICCWGGHATQPAHKARSLWWRVNHFFYRELIWLFLPTHSQPCSSFVHPTPLPRARILGTSMETLFKKINSGTFWAPHQETSTEILYKKISSAIFKAGLHKISTATWCKKINLVMCKVQRQKTSMGILWKKISLEMFKAPRLKISTETLYKRISLETPQVLSAGISMGTQFSSQQDDQVSFL